MSVFGVRDCDGRGTDNNIQKALGALSRVGIGTDNNIQKALGALVVP